MNRVKWQKLSPDERLRLRDAPPIKTRRRKKRTTDVAGQGRRWAGWRGMYADTSNLNGPVVVKKLAAD